MRISETAMSMLPQPQILPIGLCDVLKQFFVSHR